MKYSELEKMYNEIKSKEKEFNEVNYIPRLYILIGFKEYQSFDTLDEETKRRIIEATYYYWIQSIYPIDVTHVMAEVIMENEDSEFNLKMNNGALEIKDITKLLVNSEDYFDNVTFG